MLIKDDMLREVIARTLRITEEEITEEKLLELRNLSVRYAGVSSLEGLEYAENLETLDLCGNDIEILDPIRNLRNIERLNVSKNRLRDLQALHGFRQLKNGSSTLVQSFKKVKNFKSPLFIDDLKFFCCQVLKFYVACVVCVAPLLYNILEVFDHETLV